MLTITVFMVLSRQPGTLEKFGQIMISGIFRSARVLEGSPSFRIGIPSWMTFQNYFPSLSYFFSSCLECTELKLEVEDVQVPSCSERGIIVPLGMFDVSIT